MKILSVSKLYYPWTGGVEKIVQQVTEGIKEKADFESEVLCCQAKGERKIETVNGVKVFRASSWRIFLGMPLSFDFFRLFKELSQKADLIDFHHPFPLGDLAFFLFRPKAKLIVHYHSDIVRQNFFGFLIKPLISHTLKKAERILVSNPNLIKSSPYLKKIQWKCQLIPFGVNLEEIKQCLDEAEIGEIKKKYKEFVLFVGRLNYYKGIDYLIEAMKDIKVNLVIIGEGKQEKLLKKKTKDLEIENKVFFLPTQERKKLINFYKVSEVFVLPSIFKSEAFGIVLIEAMACGTPVVSTELGTGTSWVNINRKTGFVAPPRNSKALKETISKILENKNLAQELGQNARKRVEEEFSLDKMLRETERVYKLVIPF